MVEYISRQRGQMHKASTARPAAFRGIGKQRTRLGHQVHVQHRSIGFTGGEGVLKRMHARCAAQTAAASASAKSNAHTQLDASDGCHVGMWALSKDFAAASTAGHAWVRLSPKPLTRGCTNCVGSSCRPRLRWKLVDNTCSIRCVSSHDQRRRGYSTAAVHAVCKPYKSSKQQSSGHPCSIRCRRRCYWCWQSSTSRERYG